MEKSYKVTLGDRIDKEHKEQEESCFTNYYVLAQYSDEVMAYRKEPFVILRPESSASWRKIQCKISRNLASQTHEV